MLGWFISSVPGTTEGVPTEVESAAPTAAETAIPNPRTDNNTTCLIKSSCCCLSNYSNHSGLCETGLWDDTQSNFHSDLIQPTGAIVTRQGVDLHMCHAGLVGQML